jgi:hypothetical protein
MATQLVEEGSASDIADGKAQPGGQKGGAKYTSRRAREYADADSEDDGGEGYVDTVAVNYSRVDTSG